MESEKFGCPKCKKAWDLGEVFTKTITKVSCHCPECRGEIATNETTVGRSPGAPSDVDLVHSAIQRYHDATSRKIAFRPSSTDQPQAIWSFGTNHAGAGGFECEYDEKRPGVVGVRIVSKIRSEMLFDDPDPITDRASKFALQVFGLRGVSYSDISGDSEGCIWGLVQYLAIDVGLSPALLIAVSDCLAESLKKIEGEVFGA